MKIQLPIEASGLTFIHVMPPEPVLDQEPIRGWGRCRRRPVVDRKTRRQKADLNGEPLHSMEPVCPGRRALRCSR
jgi:hypothetical protein